MTLQEVCSTYHLDAALLQALAERGVFCAQLCDGDACRAAVACFLCECGLSVEQIAAYFLTEDGGRTQRVLLRRLRAAALERVHAAQHCVDKLDCLLRKQGECPARSGRK